MRRAFYTFLISAQLLINACTIRKKRINDFQHFCSYQKTLNKYKKEKKDFTIHYCVDIVKSLRAVQCRNELYIFIFMHPIRKTFSLRNGNYKIKILKKNQKRRNEKKKNNDFLMF